MANTFTQLYVQLIFAPKGREKMIPKKQPWMPFSFEWQDGYGAFTYSKSHINAVFKYILNKEEHHKQRTFKDEYLDFLNKFEIPYDKKYLFEFYDLVD